MKNKKIYIAGHKGMVGSAIYLKLKNKGYDNIVVKDSKHLDLRRQTDVEKFFSDIKPDFVIIAAARVGGILANSTYPWEFIYDNLVIESNIINAAHQNNVQNLIFLGSSCIYPKFAPQPLKEDYLLTGSLEPTNEWYAIAKIAGIKLCQALNKEYGRNYVSLMPTNLYGPRDNFDLQSSHVLPAMIRKFYEAKQNNSSPVILWGTGSPKREFMHVDDLADAVIFIMEQSKPLPFDLINVGTGTDLTIMELAFLIQDIVGHRGKIIWDNTKPDGVPQKLLEISRLKNMGWESKISLEDGIKKTYVWFLHNFNSETKI